MEHAIPTQADQKPLPSPLLAQVRAILNRDAQADRIALVWPEPIAMPESLQCIDETALRVVYCTSQLAMRERLATHQPGPERLVLLSPFDETQLGKDLLARLWGHEPKRISPWRTLEQLLRVNQIDPRLTGKDYRWIAESLLNSYEHYRGRVQFGEVLDFDQAWQALALGLLDFSADAVDLDALLEWSRQSGVADAVTALPEEMHAHLGDWLEPRLAEQTTLVLCLWRQGQVADMLAIGLVCSLLYRAGIGPSDARFGTIFQARVRLSERFFGGQTIDDRTLQAYGAATVAYLEPVLRAAPHSAMTAVFGDTEQLLASLDLLPLAVESDLLPSGFGQRLERFAVTLQGAANGGSMDAALDSLAALRRHRLASVRQEQVRTAILAMRTCGWLRLDEPRYTGLSALTQDYLDNGGYLDWARSRLWSGDEHEALSRVYEGLSKGASARRERLNEAFAGHLPAIARGDRAGDTAIPVEEALQALVAPLARQQPVLLLVLDGMSQAVYRELSDDLLQQGWVELQRAIDGSDRSEEQLVSRSVGRPACLLAALPTVTRISRYSLLAGSLGAGSSGDEKKAFAAHPALKALSSTRFPPQLFHKAELQQAGSGALSDTVRAAIAGREHKLVGAVINAVDDLLSTGAQLTMNWSVSAIGLLPQLLDAAREAGRLVIFTSDHGHVLDHAMVMRESDADAERYKLSTTSVGDGEIAIEGKRVLLAGNRCVLPWSERIRYAPKKMGYHGGGTPQEVLIPFGVYRNAGDTDPLVGWCEVPRQEPQWWRLDADAAWVVEEPAAASAEPRSRSGAKSKKGLKPQQMHRNLDLFADALPTVTDAESAQNWITALVACPVYAQMKARAGRVMIGDDQLRQCLLLLAQSNGQQMLGALAQALQIPAIRMNGFLAGLQKLLNVDGYPVLSIDRAAKTVKLDIRSLKVQFELADRG